MTPYRYVKARPKRHVKSRFALGEKRKRLSLLPGVLLLGGIILLANVTLPIIFYQLRSKANFSQPLLSPMSRTSAQVLGEERVIDYSEPASWFPTAPKLPLRPSKITHYTLSIPKLKIKEAVVEIGGKDLMESLIHYSGTALPGQYGNVVIFGHSVLPQFFNPENYKTIFSTLPTLEKGDEVLVNFDGIEYRYQVIRMLEVDPSDTLVLAQYYDSQYLTLITCVPPGTYLKRLIVRAGLR